MRSLSFFALFAILCGHLPAQTTSVLKDKNNRLIDSLKVPSAKTFTIESGGTLNVTGATLTGFPSPASAWADITGKPSTFPPAAHNQAWSTITSTPTTLAGYGIADAITAATAATTYQPLDSDLTSIAALTTTTFGRSLLTLADAAALRTSAGLVIGTDVQAYDADLASLAGLATQSYGRSLLTLANASALRSAAGLILDEQVAGVTLEGVAAEVVTVIVQTLSTPSSLDGEHFDLAGDGEMVRFWFDVNDASTAPSGSGVRLVEINLAGADGRFDVAQKINTALSGDAFFGTLGLNGLVSGSDPIGTEIVYGENGPQSAPSSSQGIIEVTVTTAGSLGTPKLNAMSGALLTDLNVAEMAGLAASATTDATNASNISSGTLNIARLADTSITNAKLAGSIALSKLAITGTPDGTKFIRDDGSYQAINLSGYLPLTGGTLTGPLAITGGTVTSSTNPLTITQTWNGAGIVFQGPRITITDTQSSITEQFFGFYAGASGTTKLFAVEKIGGSNVVEVPSIRSTSNTWSLDFSELGLALGSARRLSWASTVNYYDSKDLIISRDGAAKLKLGLDSATPVSQQILTAHASGTNIAASNLTLGGSLSTGTGAGGDVIEVTSMSGSSGSSANVTQTRRQTIGRFINLTEGTATNVASIALPSGKVTGGTATLTVWASDGTDHQALTSEIRFSAVNKAGTLTATTSQTDGTTAASAGTLTVTYTATASGNNLLLRADATSSLTQTILRARLVITALNGDDVQTVTPQ